MPPDRPQALQDTFLDHVRQHKVTVTVYLASGIRLQGYVTGFDSYSPLLVRDRQAQLIYNSSTSTQSPPSCPASQFECLRHRTIKERTNT